MATQLVPYTSAMKFESSFNSFTQTLCIDNAVVRDPDPVADVKEALAAGETNVAQSVIYKTSIIEKATDVVKATRVRIPCTAQTLTHYEADTHYQVNRSSRLLRSSTVDWMFWVAVTS